MTSPNCLWHNMTTRVDVSFKFSRNNESFGFQREMELLCRCRVYKQLKSTFLELASAEKPRNPCEIVFTSMSYMGAMAVKNGDDIYNNIMPELNPSHSLNPQLILQVDFIDLPESTLERLKNDIADCRTAFRAEKKWRVLKDTEIAEDQLTMREFLEKQQKQIKEIQSEMKAMKIENEQRQKKEERREKEEERRFTKSEVHEAVCDQCDDLIIGHRFKCAICFNYDLCQKCESQGAHPQHAMIRMVSVEHTDVPAHLIPRIKVRMENKETQMKYSENCFCKSDVRANAKKVKRFIEAQEKATKLIREMRASGDFIAFLKQSQTSESIPEITIEPPVGQTAPFNHSDYLMKLSNFPQLIDNAGEKAEFWETLKRTCMQKEEVKNQKNATGASTEIGKDNCDDTKSVSSDSSDLSDSSDSSVSSRASVATSMSFVTLIEILRDIEELEFDTLSQKSGEDTAEEFDIVEKEEEKLHTAVPPTPETTD